MKTAAAGALGSLMVSDVKAAQDQTIQPDGSQSDKPNILVIMGDDSGYWNLSAYNMGMMGYRTPNTDRIAQEGMIFTDAYGEQSCTAGRAAFISGQHPVRTGLLRIGFPGQDLGLHEDDPTLAELLKPEGYVSGQFGKNHLGDMNKYMPTVRGFDEFLGNSTTSTPKMNPSTKIIQKILPSLPDSGRVVLSTVGPRKKMIPPRFPATVASVSR